MAARPRTFADDLPPEARDVLVVASCCGRRVMPDYLVDCDRLAIALRVRGARYLCDGCRETLRRTGHEAALRAAVR